VCHLYLPKPQYIWQKIDELNGMKKDRLGQIFVTPGINKDLLQKDKKKVNNQKENGQRV